MYFLAKRAFHLEELLRKTHYALHLHIKSLPIIPFSFSSIISLISITELYVTARERERETTSAALAVSTVYKL